LLAKHCLQEFKLDCQLRRLTERTIKGYYPAYKKGQLNVSELARVCDISRTTVYKYIEILEL
jgi:response regulator of citrate/malate metabolism